MKILIFSFQHIQFTDTADTSASQSARLEILPQPEGIVDSIKLSEGLRDHYIRYWFAFFHLRSLNSYHYQERRQRRVGPSKRKLKLKVILGSSTLHTFGPTMKMRETGKAICSNEKIFYRYSFQKKKTLGQGRKQVQLKDGGGEEGQSRNWRELRVQEPPPPPRLENSRERHWSFNCQRKPKSP